ncbi:MAG TPA: hypothetical protein VLM05_22770 [Mycobacteriales bacterium]|nr:hypothetical protein [Mycobacteriales bacterium]
MTYDDEQAVRDRLDAVARSAPPLSFGPSDLVRRGRQRRRQRRRAAVLTAAVAAVGLVVAVPAAVLRGGGPVDATSLVGSGSIGSAPRPAPAATAPARIPGVSAAELGQINLGCGQAYGGDIGHVNPTPGPGETQGPLVRDAVHAYNVLRYADGDLHVLLYGPGVALTCDRKAGNYNAGGYSGGNPVALQWLPGAISIDLDGGDETGRTVAGRVTGRVATVRVRVDDRSTRIAPVNGTYLARLTGGGGRVDVTAYGRDGRPIETRTQGDIECYTTPDGTVVIQGSDRTTGCRPATPWR